MRWFIRLLVALPFVIAALLTVLMASADRLHFHREHIAGYGFLFGAPWAWLLDHPGLLAHVHSRRLMALSGYVVILWIPAALYSACAWLLFVAIGKFRDAR
jgi:hypothetical protein